MTESSRFEDKGDGSILDNNSGLVWSKEDSWPVAQDWLTFQEALLFVDEMNKKDYQGYHDWRIPEREEIEKIFIPESTIMGRSNSEVHLDPLFSPGGGNAGRRAGGCRGQLQIPGLRQAISERCLSRHV